MPSRPYLKQNIRVRWFSEGLRIIKDEKMLIVVKPNVSSSVFMIIK